MRVVLRKNVEETEDKEGNLTVLGHGSLLELSIILLSIVMSLTLSCERCNAVLQRNENCQCEIPSCKS